MIRLNLQIHESVQPYLYAELIKLKGRTRTERLRILAERGLLMETAKIQPTKQQQSGGNGGLSTADIAGAMNAVALFSAGSGE